jgi:Tat protein secretion system quality control protein TatD with DNase activity
VKVIANAVDMQSYEFARTERGCNPNVHKVFIGLHADRADVGKAGEMVDYIMNNNVDGVGEIGLDVKYGNLDAQKEVFAKFLEVAGEKNLPVAVHSRNCVGGVLDALEGSGLRVMMHWFSGDEKQLAECVEKGYFIGVTPAHAGKDKWIIEQCPAEQLLLETDSPVLGRRPADIVKLAARVAEIKGIEKGRFIVQQENNVRKFCGQP